LILSDTSGSSGLQTVTVTVESEALTDTTIVYLGQLTFVCQGIQKVVYVELILVQFIIDGFESGKLYFSDDRNKLVVTNLYANMYLQAHAVASNGTTNTPYILEAPYQNGYAKCLIGMEANVLLKSPGALTSFSSAVRNRVRPININLTAYNKNKTTGATSVISAYTGLKFLTGKTPATE